ncbi:MAG: hypothetical protein ACPGRX_02340 [Bdellovibrionales bacterium]
MKKDKISKDSHITFKSSGKTLFSKPYQSGGWNVPKDPATNLFRWGRIKKQTYNITIDMKLDSLCNDNAGEIREHRSKAMLAVAMVMVFASTLAMNSSSMATQAVMHADDQLLVSVHNASPNTLARVLNAMDVGEQ